MKKRFIGEAELICDSFRLGVRIYNDGFRPTFVVGLWRGGSSVGIYVQECLQHLGVATDHIAIRTSYRGKESYEIEQHEKRAVRVHGTQYLLETLNAEDRLLLVDDVCSSGTTLAAVIDRLDTRLKRNMPQEVRIATVWNRAIARRGCSPDYFVRETEDWLVLPYELSGLSAQELRTHKPLAASLLGLESVKDPS